MCLGFNLQILHGNFHYRPFRDRVDIKPVSQPRYNGSMAYFRMLQVSVPIFQPPLLHNIRSLFVFASPLLQLALAACPSDTHSDIHPIHPSYKSKLSKRENTMVSSGNSLGRI